MIALAKLNTPLKRLVYAIVNHLDDEDADTSMDALEGLRDEIDGLIERYRTADRYDCGLCKDSGEQCVRCGN